jgi:hypothetical protein
MVFCLPAFQGNMVQDESSNHPVTQNLALSSQFDKNGGIEKYHTTLSPLSKVGSDRR